MELSIIQTLIAGSLIAASGGMLGSFALLRRMALVGDALSHVALPGLALGLLFHFNPLLGSAAFLFLGTTIIWAVEHKTKLPVDTVVGVLFVTALAAGSLMVSNLDLLEALFGDITKLTMFDFWIASVLSLLLIVVLISISKKLTLSLISTEIASSVGLRPHFIEFLFLSMFALIVAIGVKFTGVLLIGSLIIIPAAIARNLAKSMQGYLFLSALFGVVGAVVGILLSSLYGFAPGPAFILFLGPLFFVSVFFRR